VCPVEARLHAALADKCRQLGCVPLAVGGVSDHVHVLVAWSRTVTVAELAKGLKGSSSHLMNHTICPTELFRWEERYSAFTVGHSELETVRTYVLQQRQHHARGTASAPWEPATAGLANVAGDLGR
jgi:REP element-mobilizing transposase RayT